MMMTLMLKHLYYNIWIEFSIVINFSKNKLYFDFNNLPIFYF